MKRILIASAMCISAVVANAGENTSMLAKDKRMHIGASFVIGFAAGNVMENKLAAFGVAMVPGVLKEISDRSEPGNKFSVRDLAADAIGAAIGVHAGGWFLARRGGQTVIGYHGSF